MTQAVAAPLPMTGIATAQAATAAAPEMPDGMDAAADFAAVLQAQFSLPAKDAPGAEILAALLPAAAATATADAAAETTEAAQATPDLASLLPQLAGLAPLAAPAVQVAADTVATGGQPGPGAEAAQASAPSLVRAGDTAVRLAAEASQGAEAATAGMQQMSAPDARQSETQTVFDATAEMRVPAEAGLVVVAENGRVFDATAEMRVPAASDNTGPSAPSAGTAAVSAPAHAPSRAAEHAPAALRVDTPVGSRGWDAELGQKVVLLVGRQESRAELTLTPPQLGRVEISITVSGDQTSAAFVSASPAAREALEQALPRLREILAESGITLGEASVHAESPRQDGEGSASQRRAGSGHGGSNMTADAGTATPSPLRSEGLVDTFA
jgi:flagellar hook-length control protein FliK